MSSRTQTIDNLTSCYDDVEALMADLTPSGWEMQSLCPDWKVRGVITHLAAIESVLDGWAPTADAIAPPFDQIGTFTKSADDWTPAELAANTSRLFANRREQLAASTDEQFAARSMTPIGEATYHRFMDIRVFDFWVHVRDMAIPLDWPTSDDGPTAVRALDEVHDSIGYIVGKRVGLPDGMSIAFHLTGPVKRDIYAAVDGRASKVDHLDDPSVELTTDTVTFMLLACGRIDPQVPIDDGRITWSGDPTWAETAARNLRFTF